MSSSSSFLAGVKFVKKSDGEGTWAGDRDRERSPSRKDDRRDAQRQPRGGDDRDGSRKDRRRSRSRSRSRDRKHHHRSSHHASDRHGGHHSHRHDRKPSSSRPGSDRHHHRDRRSHRRRGGSRSGSEDSRGSSGSRSDPSDGDGFRDRKRRRGLKRGGSDSDSGDDDSDRRHRRKDDDDDSDDDAERDANALTANGKAGDGWLNPNVERRLREQQQGRPASSSSSSSTGAVPAENEQAALAALAAAPQPKARMDWMLVGSFPSSSSSSSSASADAAAPGVSSKTCDSDDESEEAVEARKQAARERRRAQQEETAKALESARRAVNVALPAGLYDPFKHERNNNSNTTSSASNTSVPAAEPVPPSTSSPAVEEAAGTAALSAVAAASTAALPAWKQKLLSKKAAASSTTAVAESSLSITADLVVSAQSAPATITPTEDAAAAAGKETPVVAGSHQPPQQQHMPVPSPVTSSLQPAQAGPQPPKPPKAVDLNKLAAAAMKAGIMGDKAKQESLQRQIDEAKAAEARYKEELQRYNATNTSNTSQQDHDQAPPTKRRRVGDDDANDNDSSNGNGNNNVVVINPLDEHGRPIKALLSHHSAALEREDLRRSSSKFQGRKNPAKTDLFAASSAAIATAAPNAGAPASVGVTTVPGRQGFFAEDLKADDLSVTELLRREREEGRHGGASFDAAIAQGIARHGRFQNNMLFGGGGGAAGATGMDEDDHGNIDDLARIASGQNKENRFTAAERQKRDMQQAISLHKRAEEALQSCPYCFDNPRMKKHCIISLGEHCLLMVPPDGPKLPGHLVIAPLGHIPSMRDADEAVYNEVNLAKARLHKHYASLGQDVLFIETVMPNRGGAGGPVGGTRRHTRIDVIPMDQEVAFDAPLYFKKALTDADQWAATNRAVIDTAGKGLKRSIPSGFPYFFVSWQGGGYVHVIGDEGSGNDNENSSFPSDFGISVCAGMMGIASVGEFRSSLSSSSSSRGFGGVGGSRGGGRGGGSSRAPLSFEEEKRTVLSFLKTWEKFDWTNDLDGGGTTTTTTDLGAQVHASGSGAAAPAPLEDARQLQMRR